MSIAILKNRYAKFGLAALVALTFCMVHPSSTAYAKKRKRAKFGTIRIQSTPAGLPIEINGEAKEPTSSTGYRDFERLQPGLYSIVVILPNGKRWTREIDLEAGRVKCVDITYKKPECWNYPLTASIAKTSRDGDVVVAYKSSVTYDGPGPLNYIWTVSPSSARIVSGGTGNPDIAIDTSEVKEAIKVTLVVNNDDGSGDPRCKAEAVAEIGARERCSSVSAVSVSPASPYYRSGDKVTFTAQADFPASTRPKYRWTVMPAPARIIEGADTESIIVDTAGMDEKSPVTASVVVDDDDGANDAECPPARAEASVTCGADCGPVRNLNDLKHRLDDFGTKLQTTPDAEGLIYIYGPRRQAETVSRQARNYLVNERGVDRSRVKVQAVGGSDKVHFEFYVVGRGEQAPPPDMRQLNQLDPVPGIQRVPGYPRRPPVRRRGRRR